MTEPSDTRDSKPATSSPTPDIIRAKIEKAEGEVHEIRTEGDELTLVPPGVTMESDPQRAPEQWIYYHVKGQVRGLPLQAVFGCEAVPFEEATTSLLRVGVPRWYQFSLGYPNGVPRRWTYENDDDAQRQLVQTSTSIEWLTLLGPNSAVVSDDLRDTRRGKLQSLELWQFDIGSLALDQLESVLSQCAAVQLGERDGVDIMFHGWEPLMNHPAPDTNTTRLAFAQPSESAVKDLVRRNSIIEWTWDVASTLGEALVTQAAYWALLTSLAGFVIAFTWLVIGPRIAGIFLLPGAMILGLLGGTTFMTDQDESSCNPTFVAKLIALLGLPGMLAGVVVVLSGHVTSGLAVFLASEVGGFAGSRLVQRATRRSERRSSEYQRQELGQDRVFDDPYRSAPRKPRKPQSTSESQGDVVPSNLAPVLMNERLASKFGSLYHADFVSAEDWEEQLIVPIRVANQTLFESVPLHISERTISLHHDQRWPQLDNLFVNFTRVEKLPSLFGSGIRSLSILPQSWLSVNLWTPRRESPVPDAAFERNEVDAMDELGHEVGFLLTEQQVHDGRLERILNQLFGVVR